MAPKVSENGAAVYPTAALRRSIDEAAQDPSLTTEEKLAELRLLKQELTSLGGQTQSYINDLELLREAEAMQAHEAMAIAKENVEIRDELIRRGVGGCGRPIQ